MLPIILTLLGITISIVFLKPYLQTPGQRKTLLLTGLILLLLAIIGYLVVTYINNSNTSDAFRSGVELLKNNRDIQNKIGVYESYSYFDKDLSHKNGDSAKFKIELTGSLASIYVYCEVEKSTKGTWRILKIKQDSLVKHKDE